ncbi:hypothetical protein DUI87_14670 [Hirundo rustica rustica]|uniref:Uncharacterized protein n=1 Tax=Hirundo rustica rustica TaxID=333673 RepID=A0A3M0K5H6_HIRRU|nr:hypothetical protein DUI87_14670 [Hirundo rustica rustica]
MSIVDVSSTKVDDSTTKEELDELENCNKGNKNERKGNVNVVEQSNVVTLLKKADCNSGYPDLLKKMGSNGNRCVIDMNMDQASSDNVLCYKGRIGSS